MTRRRPIRMLTLRKKVLFASGSTAIFFAAFELLLAGLGVQPQAATTDRMAGFSSYSPLMVESTNAQGEKLLSTAQNKLHWFNQQSFPKQKAAGTLRVFCMGGSTTYGHPYWDETSFAGWLRQYLPLVEPKRRFEIINAGGISYGSFRVAALMEELSQYQPDLFIVYSAHNEFLERQTYAEMFQQPSIVRHTTAIMSCTRIWTVAEQLVRAAGGRRLSPAASLDGLPAEVDEELNHTAGPVGYHRDDAWHAKVIAAYKINLQAMIDTAQRSGAKIVLVMPAVNEKDCSPFKSELSVADAATQQAIHAYISDGDQAMEQSRFMEASQAYTQAVELDKRNADAYYKLGHAWLAQDASHQAFAEFHHAIDEDVCPLRAVAEIEAALRDVSQARHVPLVDFPSRLRSQSPALSHTTSGQVIFGQEQFLDHVHPTIEVNRQLALWIIDELQQRNLIAGTPIDDAGLHTAMEDTRLRVLASIDRDDEIFAIRNLAKVLHWSGKFAEALPRARDVLELAPRDAESRFLAASCLANIGRTQEALEEYDILFADGLGYPRAYLPYGELLAANQQFEAAKAYLLLAILRNPNSASIYESLADVHLALDEKQFAEEALAKAKQLRATAAVH